MWRRRLACAIAFSRRRDASGTSYPQAGRKRDLLPAGGTQAGPLAVATLYANRNHCHNNRSRNHIHSHNRCASYATNESQFPS
ncbi:MAG: hypothetical protein IKP58_15615 [Victivallales bacterium]|nr:hypothetical protein [Victivallales bacterium]